MKMAKQKPIKKPKSPANSGLIIIGSALITLYFNPSVQDPFNAPKMWILLILSAWLTGYLVVNLKLIFSEKYSKFLFWILVVFSLSNLGSMFFSGYKLTSFIGEIQRNNGFVTYFGLAIISIAAAMLFNTTKLIQTLFKWASITLIILSLYGFFQTIGKDFIKWNNPYNAVISTVGNPNFAAAIMAILAVITFGSIFIYKGNIILQFALIVLFLFTLFVIIRSDARQGLITLAIGVGFILINLVYAHSKKLGLIGIFTFLILGFITILGMLQVGPLQRFVYKDSVSVRGYYWRAGIEMFRDHPMFGVGLDRYGAYFKEFREVSYPLKYGFDLTSSNAHNLPIQLFATGGVLVGISYMILLIFILILGLKTIKHSQNMSKPISITLVAAWLSYQAQSIISIDNIGISIWGWLLTGSIVGMGISVGRSNEGALPLTVKKIDLGFQTLISGTLAMLIGIFCLFLFKGESNMYSARLWFNPNAPANNEQLEKYGNATVDSLFVQPAYKITIASYFLNVGKNQAGEKILLDVVKNDPRSLDAIAILAEYNKSLGKLDKAIANRLEIGKFDPWNAVNYYELGLLYKSVGDLSSMQNMKLKIDSFASRDPIALKAATDLIA
jgi:O-antigen ligase